MEVSQLDDDLLYLYNNRKSNWIPDIKYIRCSRSEWRLGPIFTEKEIRNLDRLYNRFISEASALCVATQANGSNPGLQAIVKIRMQIRNPKRMPTIPEPANFYAARELRALLELTKRGCTCTPKFLDQIWGEQGTADYVPGGYFAVFVMEKVPGHNLNHFFDLPMSERDQVRLAFSKSIREFYSLGFKHEDEGRRNLVWDSENKKCYIIDLEDAYEVEPPEKPSRFIPELDWHSWEVAGPDLVARAGRTDPMVPSDKQYIKEPDDETLERWAAEAAGKPEPPKPKW
ncbi:hypothetical protein PRK78_006826 [Emydomyces testavorans]|uniref:Uncharacterized protein n=1 Tax=Emydomyces testavorans TaxID=2070801 RepID=A0AAF0DM46_9EURO|nr:hypothetical protein PRK78_006826 [Emydomyces testavorans]